MQEFRQRYHDSLRAYLREPGEEALKRTYDLGRWAITRNLGALDIVWVHHEALSACLDSEQSPERIASTVKVSSAFLLESLAAFEITHRGFREALVKLSQDAIQLAKANQMLEAQIRDRIEAEEVLREREAQLAEAQEVAHIGSWEWDIGAGTLRWTDEMYRLFRLEPDGGPLTYERYLDRVHPGDREMIGETVRRSVLTLEPFEFDHRLAPLDAGERWIHSIGRVVDSSGGRAVRMVGTAQDITERKGIHEALRRSEERFRSLIENSSDVITILNSDGTVRYKSPSVRRVLGYMEQEIVGGNIFDFIHPEDAPSLAVDFRSALLNTGESISRTYRIRHKDGSWRMLESIGKNLLGAPGIGGILVTSRDITEKVRLEEQLRETARQRAGETKQFAARVQRVQEEERQRIARELHDDICQRLTALRLRVNILEDDGTSAGQTVRRSLRSVKHELDRIITDVRRMSANLRPTALDLFGLDTALRTLCEEVQKTHGLTVRFEADDHRESRDDSQTEIALYRIAQEALHNAVRHSAASEVSLHLAHRDGTIRLAVRDNGRGFSPAAVRPGGASLNGYGLSSMRERAELLGGSFTVKSVPLSGTTVLVELPVEDA